MKRCAAKLMTWALRRQETGHCGGQKGIDEVPDSQAAKANAVSQRTLLLSQGGGCEVCVPAAQAAQAAHASVL